MTNEEILAIAHEAGFDSTNRAGLCGESELDQKAYVDEYPVGEYLIAFAVRLALALGKDIRE